MEEWNLLEHIAEIFAIHGIETEIIAASVRNPIHVIEAALAGADISTIPYSSNSSNDKTSINRSRN